MREGYPVIFYGDYYSEARVGSSHRVILDKLLEARRVYAYGDENLLFDDPNVVGLVRHGDIEHDNSGLVLLMSNNEDGCKNINLGANHAGETWYEMTGSITDEVHLDENGAGVFNVKGRNIAVWVKR